MPRHANFPPPHDITLSERVSVTTDEQLMLDVQRGTREAFEQLFDRYRAPMWRFFRRRVADPARAEELAQDTFVAVLQGATPLRASGALPLVSVRRRLQHPARRAAEGIRTARVERLDVEPAAPAAGDLEAEMWVRSALGSLDADDREMLMLREYEQLSYQEIADLKQMPLNTVRSRLFRARMALKAVLERPVHVHSAGDHGEGDHMTAAEHPLSPEELMAYLDGELPLGAGRGRSGAPRWMRRRVNA